MRALNFEEIHLGGNVDEIPGGCLWGACGASERPSDVVLGVGNILGGHS